MNLNDRQRKILQAVLHEFIQTAQPVGSQTLHQKYSNEFSPATIRNVLAALEQEGYLSHPHTSAGRVPTDKGYRFYVDNLMDIQRLAVQEQERIQHEYQARRRELSDVLLRSARILSALSQYTGFVITPKPDRSILRHLDLVGLEGNKALVVLVTENGMVMHRLAELSAPIPQEILSQIAVRLSERLAGMTLEDARTKLAEKLEEEAQQQKQILSLAEEISKVALDLEEQDVFLEGASNILGLPDFTDHQQLGSLARLMDEKKALVRILDGRVGKPGIQVLIGPEALEEQFRNISIVTDTYETPDHLLGLLGIIGPKRMQYDKMVALVDYISKSINDFMGAGKKDVAGRLEHQDKKPQSDAGRKRGRRRGA